MTGVGQVGFDPASFDPVSDLGQRDDLAVGHLYAIRSSLGERMVYGIDGTGCWDLEEGPEASLSAVEAFIQSR